MDPTTPPPGGPLKPDVTATQYVPTPTHLWSHDCWMSEATAWSAWLEENAGEAAGPVRGAFVTASEVLGGPGAVPVPKTTVEPDGSVLLTWKKGGSGDELH